jgi:PAS domain S-box-containing protein
VPLHSADGAIIGIVGINDDITARKQNEDALRKSEELYRTLVQNLPNIVVNMFDKDLRYTLIEGSALHRHGFQRSTLEGKTVREVLSPDRAQLYEPLYRAALNGQVSTLETTRDGYTYYVTIVPVKDENGEIFAGMSLSEDITERKQAQAKLEYQAHLLANVNDAVIASDENFNLTSWNPAAEKMYGWKAEEVLGKPGPEVFRTEFIDEERSAAISRLFETGLLHAETIQYRKDGLPIDVEGDLMALRDEEGRTTGYLTVNRDISERKRAENEIRKLNADLQHRAVELEAANKELEAFSYSVSHDLRAPLRAMDGFSRILLTDYAAQLDADAQRYLKLVRDNAQQMGDLINGLLNFSRLGRQSLQKTTVNPKNLIERVMQDLLTENQNRQIEWKLGDLPVCQADSILLKQVFANLLQNALKFTRQREVAQIEIGSQQVEGDTVYFVKDNGVGFDMRYAHKLFGVFQRMHRAEDFEGVGVGLATVQRIVHRHGGRIWAESELDRGATFYFTLALALRESDGREQFGGNSIS